MKYFKLGNYKISRLCLGTWSLGGLTPGNSSYGPLSSSKAFRILKKAESLGINFFDTANVYGNSEKILGRFIKKKREKFFIATKVGCNSYNKKLNFSEKNIKKQIIQSLKKLNSKYLDIVQLYNPNIKDKKLKNSLIYLDHLKKKKIIRFIGVSLEKPSDYIWVRKLYKFDTVQCNFNILDHRFLEEKLQKYLKKDGVKIFPRTVLNFGFFTEDFLKNRINFNKRDHRKLWKAKQIDNWRKFIKKVKKFSGRDIEKTCYKFCYSFKVDSLIFGATNLNHLKCAAFKGNFIKLKKNEVKFIKNIYKSFSKYKFIRPYFKMKQL